MPCESFARVIARNSVWSLFSAAAAPILMFLFGGLTIRYVGLEAAGISVVVTSIFGVAARITLLGVPESFVPRMASAIAADNRDESRTLFGTVASFSAVMSSVVAFSMLAYWKIVHRPGPSPAGWEDVGVYLLLAATTHVVATTQQVFGNVLRAAQRYDLITVYAVPTSLITGVAGCVLLPVSPHLSTVGALSLGSSLVSLILSAILAGRTVPGIRRPRVSAWALVPLIRYGAWLTAANIMSVLTASADTLMLAYLCGPAAAAPYNVAKQLFITGHTMLLQQVEHIGPALSALGHSGRKTADRIASGMLWVAVLLAGIGYSFIAWAGPVIVTAVAGPEVMQYGRIAVVSYAAYGLAMSLLIVPVTSGFATGFPKLAFLVGVWTGPSLAMAIALLGTLVGLPFVYLAPLASIPGLLVLLGATPSRLCDFAVLSDRLAVIAVPLILGAIAISASIAFGPLLPPLARFTVALIVSLGMIPAALAIEMALRSNRELHTLMARFAVDALQRLRRKALGGYS